MTSRSYYAIAGSSFLLLSLISCDEGKKDDRRDSPNRQVSLAQEGDNAPEVVSEIADLPSHLPTASVPTSKHDGCFVGELQFEGRCVDKKRVSEIVEKREAYAIEKVKKAKRPEQKALATHDLLEQQIVQADKVEDDLDEIIEQLEEEAVKAKKKEKKPE